MKMLQNLLKVGILFCFFSVIAQSNELQVIQSFRANFEQKVQSAEGQGSTLRYTGEIKALAPVSVLWEYKTPIPKEIYIDNGAMIIFEPKLQQAIFTQLQENLDLFSLLKRAKKIKENYYEKGILKEVRFKDHLGNKVEISFSNVIINSKMRAEIFEFNPSSDIDIIYH